MPNKLIGNTKTIFIMKFNSSLSIFLVLLLVMFNACKKDDVDETTIDEEDPNTQVIECELEMAVVENPAGTLMASASGGTEPYVFIWSTEATSSGITVEEDGTYGVTVTDADGCTTEQEVEVTLSTEEPCESFEMGLSEAPAGTLTANIEGGTAPYAYIWSTEATSNTITVEEDGTYTATVTDSTGCVVVASITVSLSNPCATFGMGYEINSEDLYLVVWGEEGTQPYAYLWADGTTAREIPIALGGTYEVTITDANGCVVTQTITVEDTTTPCSTLGLEYEVYADDFYIVTTPYGGTPPYAYTWSNGATASEISVFDSGSGVYEVTVTDANGCIVIEAITLEVPCYTLGLEYEVDDLSAIAYGYGGTPPYTYTWSNGTTGNIFNADEPGEYNVIITDANGCTFSQMFTVDDGGSDDCTSLGIEYEVEGLFAVAYGYGGTAPYSYLWSNGATGQEVGFDEPGNYEVTVIDVNGCTVTQVIVIEGGGSVSCASLGLEYEVNSDNLSATAAGYGGTTPYTYYWSTGETSSTIYVANPGLYEVTVVDANGCSVIQSMIIEGSGDCASFGVEYGADATTLTAIAFGYGGAEPYTYLWSNGATDQEVEFNESGTYTVTVTDANGCVVTAVIEL